MSRLIIFPQVGTSPALVGGIWGPPRLCRGDEYDIFVSKLSSKKEKHQSDLGVLAHELNKKSQQRLLRNGRAFLDDRTLRSQIEENWRFIFKNHSRSNLWIAQIRTPCDQSSTREGPPKPARNKPSPKKQDKGKARSE